MSAGNALSAYGCMRGAPLRLPSRSLDNFCSRLGVLPITVRSNGCSSGPSADEIKSALQDASISLVGDRMAPVFETIADVDCKEAQGRPGFICTFNATSFSKLMNSRLSQISEARFVRSDSKWVLMAEK